MRLGRYRDYWVIKCGLIPRDDRDRMIQWCRESWGPDWGFLGDTRRSLEFYFHRRSHAEFFWLKFNQ
jgi:hypothetical protein